MTGTRRHPEGAAAGRAGLLRDADVVLAAAIPFSFAGFGILELPVRVAESPAGYSASVEGFVLAAFGLGYGAAQIPSGILTTRLGAVSLLRLAVLVCVLSWPLVLASEWSLVALGRLVFGFGAGLTYSSGLLLLRAGVARRRHGAAVAAFGTAWALGEVAAALVGESELASGVMICSMGLVALLRLRGTPGGNAMQPEGRLVGLRELRNIWTVGVRVMLIVVPAGLLGQIAITTWGPRSASIEADVSVVALGLLVAAGIAVGNWIGMLAGRSSRADRIVAASPILTGLLLAFFALAGGSETLRLVAVFLTVTASLISFPPGTARIFRETPTNLQPLATATVNQSGWIASAIGPVLLGLWTTGVQPPVEAWLTLAAVTIVAGLAALAVNGRGARQVASGRA